MDVSLTSAHGKMLTAELNGTLTATRAYESPGPWETWTFEDRGAKTFALKSHHGGYIRAEGGGGSTIDATAHYDSPGPWETFTAEPWDTGGYVLRCHDGTHFVTAELDGTISANRTAIGEWELWLLTPDPYATPPGPVPGNRVPQGIVKFNGRICTDNAGAWLAVGASFFWAPRAWKDYRDRYDKNMQWLAAHGFTFYRALVLTGGWPEPDGWRDAGAFLPWALDVLPEYLDDAFTRYHLRCSLTLFDGEVQTPTDQEQDQFVRDVCDTLLPRMHTLQDIQIANEYSPCQWDYPKGVERLRRHARTVRTLLGPYIPLSISSRTTAMMGGTAQEHYDECHKLFDGLIPDIVTVTCNHDSRETTLIDGPWRHVRQGWERVVHDEQGRPLEPDASIDDEPMGPGSSVAAEESPSLIVSKAINDFISGRHQYCYHADAGIWSTLLNPPGLRGMGLYELIQDHTASPVVGKVFQTLMPLLPPDITMWTRTRHGLTDHPFAASFQPSGELWTQIWPDQITAYGVVRAYCALNGNQFVCGLMGVKGYIELQWTFPMHFKVYACGSGECVQTIESNNGHGRLTIADSVDTDLVVIGRYV